MNVDVEVCLAGRFTTLGPCPSGTECEFGDCVEVCRPQCGPRVCGFDGCDGVCGQCEGEQACNAEGQCVDPGSECGDDVCDEGEDCALCPADCGQCCGDGACSTGQGENCATCGADCGCDEGQSCDPERRQCTDDCVTQCDGRQCGSDGCGGECAPGCNGDDVCNGSGRCVAPPAECGDRVCDEGEDCALCPADCGQCCGDGACTGGQGENCSTCPADCGCDQGQRCNLDSRVCECAPQCQGRVCGSDGCGGQCNPGCGQGFTCDPVRGLCDQDCVPQCGGRQCGSDGCGGECGPGCSQGLECQQDTGRCVAECVPQCGGRECGANGCGGQCGPGCDDNQICRFDGVCVLEPVACNCGNGQTCLDGVCRDNALVCSETNPVGLCENGFDCVEAECVNSGANCAPNNPTGICPVGQVCQGGQCDIFDDVVLCNDDNPCTADSFDSVRNRCLHVPQSVACSDGNACTTDTCQAGQCVGARINGCIEPPTIGAFVTPTNVNSVRLTGTKPAGSSVQINGMEAVPESPDATWAVTLNLAPGVNRFVIRSVDQGRPSETVEVVIVFDITPPLTTVTPGGGIFLNGLTVTVTTSEPATVFYTTDGSTPNQFSDSFESVRQIRVFDDTQLRFLSRDKAGNFEAQVKSADFEITSNGNRWQQGPTLPERVTLAGAAHQRGSIFLVGGSDGIAPQAGVYQHILADDAWLTLASLPGARSQLALVSDGTFLYAIGGEDDGTPLNSVLRLNPTVDQAWSARSPMPSTRFGIAAVFNDGKIHVFGGKSNGGVVLSNHEVYTISNNTWTNQVAQMPRPRYAFGVQAHGNKIYVVGGEDGAGVPIAAVDVYDVATNTWSQVAGLPTPRSFLGVTLNSNIGDTVGGYTGVVAAGGRSLGGISSATVEEYIIEDNVWRERTPLDAAQHSVAAATVPADELIDGAEIQSWLLGGQIGGGLTDSITYFTQDQDYVRLLNPLGDGRFKHAAVALGERIYVLGGRNFQEETTTFAYDPETESFSPIAPLPSFQNGPGAVAISDKIYVIGGTNNFGNPLATTRAYEPATNAWTTLAPMPTGRSEPAVAALGHEIFVIGGRNGVALQTVEIYDTRANTWRAGTVLPQGRTDAVAVEHNGDIYLIGGRNPSDAIVGTIQRLRAGTWTTLTGSIPVADAVAAQIHANQVVVFGGRLATGLTNQTHAYSISASTVSANDSLLLPVDLAGAVTLNGNVYILGGNATEQRTPPASDIVQKVSGRCFNGIRDGRESIIDRDGGCLAGNITYTASFSGSVPNTSSQCTTFNAWRAQLTNRTFTNITLSGSRDTVGRSCSGSQADQICKALRDGRDFTTSCGGQTWTVDSDCGGSVELVLGNTCQCLTPGYGLRPCISSDNWGGVNSNTCAGPAQTITVQCR